MSTTKDRVAPSTMWFGELFRGGVYKRNQGRITRQVTFAAMAIVFAIAALQYYYTFFDFYPVPLAVAILGLGLWVSFRIVNIPKFADFLISVEAEMNKVSWPAWGELVRSSMVVIAVIFLLAGVLFGFDLLWRFIFQLIGVLKGGGA